MGPGGRSPFVGFQKGMFGVPVQFRFPEERMGRVTNRLLHQQTGCHAGLLG